MPIYDYVCERCGHEFQVQERISVARGGSKPVCPECESPKVGRVFTPAFVKTGRKS
ncbi:MAG: zinc ribbon domain-containing protein [Gemmatimonadota bacterium]|nr:zinc ribbon domain-containing protein [Gemmatimonadota bacterium]